MNKQERNNLIVQVHNEIEEMWGDIELLLAEETIKVRSSLVKKLMHRLGKKLQKIKRKSWKTQELVIMLKENREAK